MAAFVHNASTPAHARDQGWLTGKRARDLRLRARLGRARRDPGRRPGQHATPPAGFQIGQAARTLAHRADGLTFPARHGRRDDPARIRAVKAAVPEAPVWIGSGLDAGNVAELLPLADGAIVGSTLMHGGVAGQGVDPARVRSFMAVAREVR